MDDYSISDKADVLIFPPLLYFNTLVVGLTLRYFFPCCLVSLPVSIPVGTFLLLIAIWILRLATKRLKEEKTTINPNGITTTIVKDRIYKYTRNPIYVSFTMIYVAVSIMTSAWLGLSLLIPLLVVVQKGIVKKEEQYLLRKFGAEYSDYKATVPRWV